MTKNSNKWYYRGSIYNPAESELKDLVGFVYVITDLSNNKKYVGKKLFWRTIKRPPLKGSKRRRISKVQSDWQEYYGSSDIVRLLVEEYGTERFHREIIILCGSKGEMSYLEMKEQIDREVLLRDDYYNEFIGGKIHSKHVSRLKKK